MGSHTATVPPGESTRFVAQCPGEHRDRTIVFGGFQSSPADPLTRALAAPAQFRPGGKGKIIFTAVNLGTVEPVTMTGYVYCR